MDVCVFWLHSFSLSVSQSGDVCLCVRLTCTLLQRDAGAHVDVVYPDVSSGAVHKVTLHHHLAEPKTREEAGIE